MPEIGHRRPAGDEIGPSEACQPLLTMKKVEEETDGTGKLENRGRNCCWRRRWPEMSLPAPEVAGNGGESDSRRLGFLPWLWYHEKVEEKGVYLY